MAKSETKTRTVLEPFAEFNPSDSPVPRSSIRSLAFSTLSDSQTLVYAGTDSGYLLLLSLDHSLHDNSKLQSLSFLRYAFVSDTAIDSIHLVVQFEKVIVVSDGLLYFVDTNLVQPVRRLSSLKGVRVVSRRFWSGESEFSDLVGGDGGASSSGKRFLLKLGGGIRSNGVKSKELELGRDGNCVFAAIVGKKLMIIALDLNDSTTGSVVILKEIECVDGGKTMVWVDNSIFVGTSTGYYLYSCVTGTNALIFSLPEPTSSPLLKLFVKDFKVLLLVDNVGVTVNAQGQPVGGSFVFRHSPDSVGELTTFVVAIKNGKMELYHKKSSNFIQVIAFVGEGLGQFAVEDDENSTGKLIIVETPSKNYQKGEIGITLVSHWFVPRSPTLEDLKASYRAIDFFLG